MAATQDAGRTIEQRRASDALDKIKALKELGEKQYGKYVSYVSALPAAIIMNGLGQALATQLAASKGKQEDPHYRLYEHVASWLAQQIKGFDRGPEWLLEDLMKNDQEVYLRAQAEAMAYLQWLKQFARAYLNEPEGNDNE